MPQYAALIVLAILVVVQPVVPYVRKWLQELAMDIQRILVLVHQEQYPIQRAVRPVQKLQIVNQHARQIVQRLKLVVVLMDAEGNALQENVLKQVPLVRLVQKVVHPVNHAAVRISLVEEECLIAAVIIVDFIAGAILELALQEVFVRALLRVILVFAWLVVLLMLGHVTEF